MVACTKGPPVCYVCLSVCLSVSRNMFSLHKNIPLKIHLFQMIMFWQLLIQPMVYNCHISLVNSWKYYIVYFIPIFEVFSLILI